MKEGDTPSFLGLIANGYNIPEIPERGGWGGRFRLLNNSLYIDAQDFLDGALNDDILFRGEGLLFSTI